MTHPIEHYDTYELERPMREAKKRRLEAEREREAELKGEEERDEKCSEDRL